ncbi:MAG: VOC family protein [Ardenticatenaceae bacterium]|nr:VOC family protein [Ardenticatenaceae bacterium]HBY96317.1 glyoxalase [Chloroflexota bacterium]
MADRAIHPDTTIGDVRLTVADLDRSLAFYQGALGWHVAQRDEAHVSLSATGHLPAQILLTVQPGARPQPRGTSGLYHFALLFPHRRALARALRRLTSVRVPVEGASDHLVSEAIYLSDPDGHGIELYADRPREQWPRRNGRLQMATEPLDFDGLIAELRDDDEPWRGTDPATRLGHVHLHTADLDPAAAFYRDLLGFDEMLRYGPSALFLSAGGYHHHIGLNTWAGVGVPPPPPASVRLQAFTLALPDPDELARLARHVLGEQREWLRGFYDVGTGLELHLAGPDEIGVVLAVRRDAPARAPEQVDLGRWLGSLQQ